MSDHPAAATLDPELRRILTETSVTVVLLNDERQVVFGQEKLLQLVQADAPPPAGFRAPGDIVRCVNAVASPRGCGTGEGCRLCGAHCAIEQSRGSGRPVTAECRIRYHTDAGVDDLDLSVTASPYRTGGRQYTLLTAHDIGHEKRRRALERVFFHDITNMAAGIAGLADVMRGASDPDELEEMRCAMERSARSLLDEIESQRQLASAESGELTVAARPTNSLELLREVRDALRYHSVAEGRTIAVSPEASPITWMVDPVLLRRVLVNLVKNALEATPAGSCVTVTVSHTADAVTLSVHNHGAIPLEIQRQLFHRSFSTKGPGRGLGTYSVRVLTERYLGGHVSFTSNERDGTFFHVTIPNITG
jgi:signal transduction histidine kinase